MSEMDGFDLYQIEQELRELKGQGGLRSIEIRDAELERARAKRELEHHKALIRSGMSGTVQAKEDACWLDENVLRLTAKYDKACAVESYAKAVARDLERDQSGVQTRARLALKAMELAGVAQR